MENEVQDIALTALHPIQMQQSQQDLIAWCSKKVIDTQMEAEEMQQAYEKAKRNKWKTDVLSKHANLAKGRHQYFIKIREALLAGYYIVPNFPIQMFVIRTMKDKPRSQWKEHAYQINSATADVLALGMGDYHNPHVVLEQHIRYDGEKKQYVNTHVTADKFNQIEFPINMAKPSIIDATSHAMAQKIFDQIGVLPNFRKKQDPLIIGQILGKDKVVSFMIAWHLNTNVL